MLERLGSLIFLAANIAAGWVMGGPGKDNRMAMTRATAVRNVGIGLVIATGSFAGTQAVTAATAFAVFQTVVMALITLGWGRWTIGNLTPSQGDLPLAKSSGVES